MKKKMLIIFIILLVLAVLILTTGIYFYYKTPVLAIPAYMSVEYDFQKEDFHQREVYMISARKHKSEQYILFLHGGAYTTNLTPEYWTFLSGIVDDTKATVVVPDYPLAPEYSYQDVFDMIVPLYEELITKVGTENVIVMGDSAGGGLGLALCEQEGEKGVTQPKRLILISPWLDISMTNKQIDVVQPNDPKLNKEILKVAGKGYARETDEKDYHVSPLYGPLEHLQNITIYTGTYDILNPDAKEFAKKAKESGVNIEYKEYEKAVHIWILSYQDEFAYQAKEAYQDLVNLIIKEK